MLSKGHAAPGLYSVLAERGFFPVADLEQAFILFDRSHGSGKPTCFLLHTTKGLGVSFMENLSLIHI